MQVFRQFYFHRYQKKIFSSFNKLLLQFDALQAEIKESIIFYFHKLIKITDSDIELQFSAFYVCIRRDLNEIISSNTSLLPHIRFLITCPIEVIEQSQLFVIQVIINAFEDRCFVEKT